MKKYRLNKKRFARFLATAIAIITISGITIDCFRFPESHLPTWKYHLHNDIKKGDTEAIKYYEETYIANGRELFE